MTLNLLDQRVAIQSETRAADGQGGSSPTWTTVATLYADVVQGSGREAMRGRQEVLETTYRVTFRNQGTARLITGASRLLWVSNSNLVLNVRSAPDPGKRAMYRTVVCVAGRRTD